MSAAAFAARRRRRWVLPGLLAAVLLAVWFLAGDEMPRRAGAPDREPTTGSAPLAPRDLALDEAAGGHTLARHVGRSDAELASRLEREPHLAAASTFTDRETAERAVAAALARERPRIEMWSGRRAAGNLVVRWPGDGAPLGRVLERGSASSEPADAARVILRRRGRDWHVLTAYPEVRR